MTTYAPNNMIPMNISPAGDMTGSGFTNPYAPKKPSTVGSYQPRTAGGYQEPKKPQAPAPTGIPTPPSTAPTFPVYGQNPIPAGSRNPNVNWKPNGTPNLANDVIMKDYYQPPSNPSWDDNNPLSPKDFTRAHIFDNNPPSPYKQYQAIDNEPQSPYGHKANIYNQPPNNVPLTPDNRHPYGGFNPDGTPNLDGDMVNIPYDPNATYRQLPDGRWVTGKAIANQAGEQGQQSRAQNGMGDMFRRYMQQRQQQQGLLSGGVQNGYNGATGNNNGYTNNASNQYAAYDANSLPVFKNA